jgi:hypothetical protein
MGEHQIIPMICGAVKQLVQNRHKEIDDVLVMALSRLAALKAEYFRSENVRTVSLDVSQEVNIEDFLLSRTSKTSFLYIEDLFPVH